MSDKYKDHLKSLLSAILEKLPNNSDLLQKSFVHQYFIKMPLMDLEKMDPALAAYIAASSYQFMQESRSAGAPKMRVFSPDAAKDGWASGRLILEIINDDMPFLVDSVMAELSRLGFTLLEVIHPIVRIKRSKTGALESVAAADDSSVNFSAESFIHLQLSPLPQGMSADNLMTEIGRVLEAVRLSVSDWKAILDKVDGQIKAIGEQKTPFKGEEVEEVKAFLEWLKDRNFVFLGAIEYDFYDDKKKERLSVVKGSELGVFKLDDPELKPQGLEGLPPEVLHFALIPQLMEITKSKRKSVVHRAVPMDYIGIKRFDNAGKVIGETRILGMFTSIVYYQSAGDIPIIRRKIARVLARANFDPVSHDGKSLRTILEFAPRDELFQMSEDDVFEYGIGVLSLEARPAVKLFIRKDAFQRFLSCIVFVPRERFSTSTREQIQGILERALGGTVTDFYTQIGNTPLARLLTIVKTEPGKIPHYKQADIEKEIGLATSQWSDALKSTLKEAYGDAKAEDIFRRFDKAFPKTYTSLYDAEHALYDLAKIEEVIETKQTRLELFRTRLDAPEYLHLKLYNLDTQVALSDILPMMENLGFHVIDEIPFLITNPDTTEPDVWVRDFKLTAPDAKGINIAALKPLLEEALALVWNKQVENDGFNALTLKAALPARDITLFRAYAKYIKQTGASMGIDSIIQALTTNPNIAQKIVALFYTKFAPNNEKIDRVMNVRGMLVEIDHMLGGVTNLSHDRVIRRYCDVIQATLRTNFFQTTLENLHKSYVSFKISSAHVPDLPKPHPYAEIFVYSPRMEGIHLRGGKVARGGLRWSDRMDDFRTEILGLMKAQMVKNSVIVPVGSKGGFVLKQAPKASERDAFMKEGVACYQMFLSGLLDITDNIVGGKVTPPDNVVRHDGDDPYLVVAADKGTASFSDYANAVSAQYHFWLGDAFASGGSVGYDHKKMAITARGAFISVARHFREMGRDIYAQDFSCVGIGDMAGDVFGNGMLLSKHIKLVAAFNHMHIFIDPTPDAAKSFAERKRLFDLPRSSWMDYNAKLISKGGGIFERSAKFITLSPEAKAALDIQADSITPDELIKAILLAPVDLLWNGGIGTYVKAEDETHEQVGDRSNNTVRVNGKQLRAKVIGEGGNLGFTQKGRIEYCKSGAQGLGGKANTDAIDNSAGVDCSDHEVNIKIAFGGAISSGNLTLDKRNTVLASMTDEVAELVLKDNRLQTQALTLGEQQGTTLLEPLARLMQQFERTKDLDRAIEFLPNDKQIEERKAEKRGLTRPELAVLLSYSKMILYRQLLESDLPDDTYFERDLLRYFPAAMQSPYKEFIANHPLRREIIATVITNSIVNRAGIAFVHGIAEDTGIKAAEVAKAYVIARDAFGLREIWDAIEALDGKIPVSLQATLFTQVNYFVERVTLWFLRSATMPINIKENIDSYLPGIKEFTQCYRAIISESVSKAYAEKIEQFSHQNIPAELTEKIARMEIFSTACDIIKVASASGKSIEVAGRIYFGIGAALKLGWLRRSASRMLTESYWDRLASQSLIQQLYDQQRSLAARILSEFCNDDACITSVEDWMKRHEGSVSRYLRFIEELRTKPTIDFPRLILAGRQVDGLA